MFESEASRLYFVAAAPPPMASSTTAENPAYVSPWTKAYVQAKATKKTSRRGATAMPSATTTSTSPKRQ